MSISDRMRLVGGALSFGLACGAASAVVIDPGHAVAYEFAAAGGPFTSAGSSISFAVADATPFMALSVSLQASPVLGEPQNATTLTIPGGGVWTWYLPAGLPAVQDGSFYVVASASAGWVGVDLVHVMLQAADGSLVGAQPIATVPLPVPEPSSLALLAGGLVAMTIIAKAGGIAARPLPFPTAPPSPAA